MQSSYSPEFKEQPSKKDDAALFNQVLPSLSRETARFGSPALYGLETMQFQTRDLLCQPNASSPIAWVCPCQVGKRHPDRADEIEA